MCALEQPSIDSTQKLDPRMNLGGGAVHVYQGNHYGQDKRKPRFAGAFACFYHRKRTIQAAA